MEVEWENFNPDTYSKIYKVDSITDSQLFGAELVETMENHNEKKFKAKTPKCVIAGVDLTKNFNMEWPVISYNYANFSVNSSYEFNAPVVVNHLDFLMKPNGLGTGFIGELNINMGSAEQVSYMENRVEMETYFSQCVQDRSYSDCWNADYSAKQINSSAVYSKSELEAVYFAHKAKETGLNIRVELPLCN